MVPEVDGENPRNLDVLRVGRLRFERLLLRNKWLRTVWLLRLWPFVALQSLGCS